MRRTLLSLVAAVLVLAAVAVPSGTRLAQAQPAKGAPAAFERVRDVMAARFKDEKLAGDPDQDFAALLIATYEELAFLSKTQLEYGGDRHLRDIAQRVQDDQQRQIDDIKQWQVRSRQAGYRTQPDQPPPGSGPSDAPVRPAAAAPAVPKPAPQVAQASQQAASSAPLVSGTVKKVDVASGKVTLDHGRIPNIDMDAMTMAYKVQAPAMLDGLKPGDKVRFSAEEVNGQTLVTRIQSVR